MRILPSYSLSTRHGITLLATVNDRLLDWEGNLAEILMQAGWVQGSIVGAVGGVVLQDQARGYRVEVKCKLGRSENRVY